MLLRQLCLRAVCSSPSPLEGKSAGCLSACNPAQPHRSGGTRLRRRPTSASSCGQILNLLRNSQRSWTAFICSFLTGSALLIQGREVRTHHANCGLQQTKFSDGKTVGNKQNTVTTLSDGTFSRSSFCKTGYFQDAFVWKQRASWGLSPLSFQSSCK